MANERKQSTKKSILRAAMQLLEKHGPEGLTTRAVCDAVEITAPTLYYHFGDKRGLLDAVVAEGFEEFLRVKREPGEPEDPREALLAGWDRFLGFASEKPQLYGLLVQRLGENPEAIRIAMTSTEKNLERLSEIGVLKVDVNFARNALLAVALGVTSKTAHIAEQSDLKAMGRFLMKSTLDALTVPKAAIRTKRSRSKTRRAATR